MTDATAPASCAVSTLAELRERPDLLLPPVALVPRLAWAGRVTLWAGEPKGGKSTFAAAGAAMLSRGGYFLGDYTPCGRVLWLSSDNETLGDIVARFARFRAEPQNVDVVTSWDRTPSSFLAVAYARQPSLIVIDTLATYAELVCEDFNNAAGWVPVLGALKRCAIELNAAIVLIHHGSKATGRYRDSSHIGAAVDVILEVQPVEDRSPARKVRARGRFPMEDFTVRLDGDTYALDSADLRPQLDARLLAAIEAAPGLSATAYGVRLNARKADVLASLPRLAREGVIVNAGSDKRPRWTRSALSTVPTVPDGSGNHSSGTGGNGSPPFGVGTVPSAATDTSGTVPLLGNRSDPTNCPDCDSTELTWLNGEWGCEACGRERLASVTT